MNKVLLLVITFLFVAGHYIVAQTSEASVYGYVEYKCFPDSVAFKRRMVKLKDENPQGFALYGSDIRAANQSIELLSFDLYFNDSVSYSTINKEVEVDNSLNRMQLNAAKAMLNAESVFSRRMAAQTKLYETSLNGGSTVLHVLEPFDKYDWSLSVETKKIGKYNCRKALATFTKMTMCCGEVVDTITAWFTPEIPFPFGPLGYDGLPGLILEVATGGEISYVFRATSIEVAKTSKKSIPELLSPAMTLTQEEFDDLLTKKINKIRRN